MLRAPQHRISRAGRKLLLGSEPLRAFQSHLPALNTVCSFGDHRRLFGSFQNSGQDNWYRESLRTVVADLKRELEEDPNDGVPAEPLDSLQEQDDNKLVQTKPVDTIKELKSLLEARASLENVNQAFSLLDQFALEKSEGRNRLDFGQLDTVFLNSLVSKWKECWNHKASRAQGSTELLTPWVLLEHLSKYQDSFPELMLDTDTYNSILSVTSENHDEDDFYQIALFVQSVVDQMLQEATEAGMETVRPNSETYNILVRTWARAGKLQEVQNIMKALQDVPDVHINRETLEAVSVASLAQLETISQLQKELNLPSFINTDVEIENADPKDELQSRELQSPPSSEKNADAENQEFHAPVSLPKDTNMVISDPEKELRRIQSWTKAGSAQGVSLAFQKLDQMILSQAPNTAAFHVPTDLVDELLLAWKKLWMERATNLKPIEVVDRVLKYHDQRNGFRLNTKVYNNLLFGLGQNPDLQQSLRWFQHIYERMQKESLNGNAEVAPNKITYDCLIRYYARAGHIQGALDLIIYLRDEPYEGPEAEIQIRPSAFTTILDACLAIADPKQHRNLGALAESVVDLMAQIKEAGRLSTKEGQYGHMEKIYKRVIKCWKKSKHLAAPRKIKAISHQLGMSRRGDPWVTGPNASLLIPRESNRYRSNNPLMVALGQHATAEALQVRLESMIDDFESGKLEVEPNQTALNDALLDCAKQGAGEQAEQLLQAMVNLHQNGRYPNVQPDAVSFTCCIEAWAHFKPSHRSSDRAMRLVHELERYSSEHPEDVSLKPTTRTYSGVIMALAKDKDAKGAESILQKLHEEWDSGNSLVQPTTLTYNAVLLAWARSCASDAGIKAEELLQRMRQLHEDGVENILPDAISYSRTIDAWDKSDSPRTDKEAKRVFEELLTSNRKYDCLQLEADGSTFEFLLGAWERWGMPEQAEEWMLEQCRRYMEGQAKMAPDMPMFNRVIMLWAHSKKREAGDHAVRLLVEMLKLNQAGFVSAHPSSVSYNNAIKAYAHSDHPQRGEKAESVLKIMAKNSCRPDKVSYFLALRAWERGGKPERAESFLRQMVDDYANKTSTAKPDAACFNSLMFAYHNAKDPQAGPKADAILKWMEELGRDGTVPGLEPEKFSYQKALWCWKERSRYLPNAQTRIDSLVTKVASFKD